MLLLCLPPVTVGGKQRHSRRLHPTAAHLQLHQRAGLRLPPAQPEERPPEKALRRPQVRREEDRGGGLRPVHPRADQGARVRRGQVELRCGDGLWETEEGWDLYTAAAPYPTWAARPRGVPEAPTAEDRLCECECWMSEGWQGQ